jgi:hypothetical protein
VSTADIPLGRPVKESRKARKSSLDIPRIKLLSWLGLESIVWGVVIGHIVKWIGNALYYIFWQSQASFGSAVGKKPVYTWNAKDFYDRFPVHLQNGLRWVVAVAIGIAVFALVLYIMRKLLQGGNALVQLLSGFAAMCAGATAGLAASVGLSSWRVHWFATQATPIWWFTWRHDIRDVGISMFATIVVLFMFQKPKYPMDDEPPAAVYARSIPLGVGVALIPIAAIGVLAWQIPWLVRHGWAVPASYGALASEVNGFIMAGTWITIVMGVVGGIVAKLFISRVADDLQWEVSKRSAAKIFRRRNSERGGLAGKLDSAFSGTVLRTDRVIGTPAHRKRVRWILDNRPDMPARALWLTYALMAAGVLVLPLAAFGAWLTLVGPAAVH